MDTNELNLLLQFRKSLMEPLLAKCQEFSSAELNNQLVLELTRIFGFKRVRFLSAIPDSGTSDLPSGIHLRCLFCPEKADGAIFPFILMGKSWWKIRYGLNIIIGR